ncbi:hypothetical protein EV182_001199 [Spiromyces aspiralis]|uniref:Uncharacterized protein n=1 Tax=Spiromyces aspiralis TaxID=68401 RepID=A0ACC1HXL4_9FUNG|nr:hypothetical protein EV182_001199 [Spiromyces aspiralis]
MSFLCYHYLEMQRGISCGYGREQGYGSGCERDYEGKASCYGWGCDRPCRAEERPSSGRGPSPGAETASGGDGRARDYGCIGGRRYGEAASGIATLNGCGVGNHGYRGDYGCDRDHGHDRG